MAQRGKVTKNESGIKWMKLDKSYKKMNVVNVEKSYCSAVSSKYTPNSQSVFNKTAIVAPTVKKTTTGPTVKSGTGAFGGKSSGMSTNSSSPSKISSTKPTTTLTPSKITTGLPSTATKSYAPVSNANSKTKNSSTLSIIWLPTRKKNKKKEISYNSHRNERVKERGPSMYNFMSGDHPTVKKEEESERAMLVSDGNKVPMALAGASAAAAIAEPAVITTQPEEKQELIDPDKDKDEHKDASGDTHINDKSSEGDYLEHNTSVDKSSDGNGDNKGDKVDSVYLRPPPPHKARSNASTPQAEEEDCGIKCLYYTLQCCDCVLM